MEKIKIQNNIDDDWNYLPEKYLSEKDIIETQHLILFSNTQEELVKLNKYFSFMCRENEKHDSSIHHCLECYFCYIKGNIDFPVASFLIVLAKKPYIVTKYIKLRMYDNVINSVEKRLPNFQYKLAIGFIALHKKNNKIN